MKGLVDQSPELVGRHHDVARLSWFSSMSVRRLRCQRDVTREMGDEDDGEQQQECEKISGGLFSEVKDCS